MHCGSSIPIYLADRNKQRLEQLQTHLFRCGLFNIQLLEFEEDCFRDSGSENGVMIVHECLLEQSITDFLRNLHSKRPDLYVSFLTDSLELQKTSEAFHAGAFDCIRIGADTPRRVEKMIRCIIRTIETLNRDNTTFPRHSDNCR